MDNRILKFRAWLKERNVMASVSALYHDGSINASWIDPDLYEKQKDSGLFYPGSVSGSFSRSEIEIMQFTGLKDKNGVEIYEGDIVDAIGQRFKVGFRNSSFSAEYSNDEKDFYYLGNADERVFEVIGNIHQNPNLL